MKVFLYASFVLMTLGFRHSPGFKAWPITKQNPTIWVKFCSDAPASIEGRAFENVVQDAFDSWNSIPKSFIRLADYPADPAAPGNPLPGDSTFTVEASKGRVIEVCFGPGTTGFGQGGHARAKGEGQSRTCKVELGDSTKDSESEFKKLFNHEMLHCFGWNHGNDADIDSGENLSLDEMMMLTKLYPVDSGAGDEKGTLGLGCSH